MLPITAATPGPDVTGGAPAYFLGKLDRRNERNHRYRQNRESIPCLFSIPRPAQLPPPPPYEVFYAREQSAFLAQKSMCCSTNPRLTRCPTPLISNCEFVTRIIRERVTAELLARELVNR